MRIFLTGMMGCGKSFWAPRIAATAGLQCIDLDHFIEEKTQQCISDLFETKGESYFRQIEKFYLLEIIEKYTHCIVATGGGTPCFHNNMERMKGAGKVMYLKTHLEILAERIANSNRKRPLLKQASTTELIRTLTDIYQSRKNCYEKSDHIIDMNHCDETTFAETFLKNYV